MVRTLDARMIGWLAADHVTRLVEMSKTSCNNIQYHNYHLLQPTAAIRKGNRKNKWVKESHRKPASRVYQVFGKLASRTARC